MGLRLRWTRQGIWVHRTGRSRLYPWRILTPVAILPLVLFSSLVLATNREALLLERVLSDPVYAARTIGRHSWVAIENLGSLRPVRSESPVPTVEVVVARSTLERMQEAIRSGDPTRGHEAGGDRPYFRAYYRDESGSIQVARMAYRGANAWHHWPDKPSFRIKIRRSDIARGFRYVELQRPEDVLVIRSWLPTVLAQDLGLLHEQREPVRLFINRKYRGIYERTTRAGNALAAASGRLPGTFFKGDAIYARRHIDLWSGSTGWQITGEASPTAIEQFDHFLALLRAPPSAANLQALRQVVNMDAYARWAALMAIVGSTHTNQNHNQVFFLAANQGRIEPVVWDVNGYGAFTLPTSAIDIYLHPVIKRLACDAEWVHQRNRYMYELLETSAGADAVRTRIAAQVERLRADLEADAHLGSLELKKWGWAYIPNTVRDLDAEHRRLSNWIYARNVAVREYVQQAHVAYLPSRQSDGWLRFQVGGTVGVTVTAEGTVIEGRGPNGSRVSGTSLLLLPGQTRDLSLTVATLPYGGQIPEPQVHPAPVIYDIRSTSRNFTFTNAVTGEPVAVSSHPLPMQQDVRTIHPWLTPPTPQGEIVLGPGEVELREDVHVEASQTLRIAAGTRIRLYPGVSIFSRGRTRVQGTAEAPVILEAAGAAPWGVFALSGTATGGSQFTHLRVSGGSVGRDGWQVFKGMFNAYNCPDITLDHCWFGANAVGDDAVNLAESRITITQCTWEGARSDALDLDLCTGVLRGNVFRGAGNDGLDLMTCRVQVQGCRFLKNGDKGISIGEGTLALVQDVDIRTCAIGIEVKDGSRALIADSTLLDNGIAWHAYRKKWEYPGNAESVLVNCRIGESGIADVQAESRSRLELVQTPVATILEGEHRVLTQRVLSEDWVTLMADLSG